MPDLIEVLEDKVLMMRAARLGDMQEAERIGLTLPQVECRVYHHFGPGFVIREMHIPAGTFVIGHQHKEALANSFVSGRIRLLTAEGCWDELQAPVFFVGKPGRKAAYAITDCIWQNIIATSETDIGKIEELFIEKSPQWKAAKAAEEQACHSVQLQLV